MTHLRQVLDPAELFIAVRDGFVTARSHPTEPLRILNYTAKAQYDRAWNPTIMACRGLIYRTDTEEVVARPFHKFFNYGEADCPAFDLSAPVVVTDKLDGSLGILYPTSKGHAIATRGAFTSDQAIHATMTWHIKGYEASTQFSLDWTLLFEVIYPQNRIVLNYGTIDDLVLLGAVEIATGRTMDAQIVADAFNWRGPVAETFPYRTLAEALNAPPRLNAEGLVIHFPDTDERVKVKQADYVELHRIVTGLNERAVWEHLSSGQPMETLYDALPDEFHGWVRGIASALTAKTEALAAAIELTYTEIVLTLPSDFSRKDFALQAVKSPHRAALFARLDGKDYWPMVWEAVKPEAVKPDLDTNNQTG